MNLSKKTFFYSASLAVLIVLFYVGYMYFMLPELYVTHVRQANIETAKALHLGFIESQSYASLAPSNAESSASFTIPKMGDSILFEGKGYQGTIEAKTPQMCQMLEKIRTFLQHPEAWEDEKTEIPDFSADFKDMFSGHLSDAPFKLTMEADHDYFSSRYHDLGSQFERVNAETVLFATNLKAQDTYYSNVIAFSNLSDRYVITFVPMINPSIHQIRPVILVSLPMVIAVLFLVVFLASGIFSRMIVTPIVQLARHAKSVQSLKTAKPLYFNVKGKDEISELGICLNELYEKLWSQYQALEHDNQRQEVFLQASSHQLKTPIAGALLLLDGLIGKVGKYANTEKYLPDVRQAIVTMQRMVEDLLDLTRSTRDMRFEHVDLHHLVKRSLEANRLLLEGKQIHVMVEGSLFLNTQPELMEKIVDNLISNAIHHSGEGACVTFSIFPDGFSVKNTRAHVEDTLKPFLTNPFVKGRDTEGGHGLGLYLVQYSVRLLGGQFSIDNTADGVIAAIHLPRENILAIDTMSSSVLHTEMEK